MAEVFSAVAADTLEVELRQLMAELGLTSTDPNHPLYNATLSDLGACLFPDGLDHQCPRCEVAMTKRQYQRHLDRCRRDEELARYLEDPNTALPSAHDAAGGAAAVALGRLRAQGSPAAVLKRVRMWRQADLQELTRTQWQRVVTAWNAKVPSPNVDGEQASG